VVVVSAAQHDSNPASSTILAMGPIIVRGPPIPIPYSMGRDSIALARLAPRPALCTFPGHNQAVPGGCTVSDLLDDEEIEQRLDELGDWEREGDTIEKVFEFDDFALAMKFVNDVAKFAEQKDHHPDIDIRWNKVKLVLTTHAEGGLTPWDFDFANEVEQTIAT
jgi:4a-hydroxytetrahydrobiopterin dehydratase